MVVAEGFVVEELMIFSKAGVVGVGGWGCVLHLSRTRVGVVGGKHTTAELRWHWRLGIASNR